MNVPQRFIRFILFNMHLKIYSTHDYTLYYDKLIIVELSRPSNIQALLQDDRNFAILSKKLPISMRRKAVMRIYSSGKDLVLEIYLNIKFNYLYQPSKYFYVFKNKEYTVIAHHCHDAVFYLVNGDMLHDNYVE